MNVIPEHKRSHLLEVLGSKDALEDVERRLAAAQKQASTSGLDSKEAESAEPEEPDSPATPATEEEEQEPASQKDGKEAGSQKSQTDGTQSGEPETPEYVTVTDVVTAVKPLVEAVKAQGEQLEALQNQVKALAASDEEKVAKAAAGTPAASLKELLGTFQFSEEGKVKEGDPLAGAKPAETDPKQATYEGMPAFIKDIPGIGR